MRFPRGTRPARSGRPAGRTGTGPRGTSRQRPEPSQTGRATNRPGGTRRPAAAARRGDIGARRGGLGGLTGRAAVLGLVVCALVLSLAYPLKQYLVQRAAIAQLRQQQQAVQERVTSLEERQRQLSDPAYTRTQARKRLQYVTPGEKVYVVVTPSPSARPEPAASPTVPANRGSSWYGRLWETVETADGPGSP